MKHEQNVGTVERWIRIIGGTIVALVGLILLLQASGSILWIIAGIAVILLGLDFVWTGITGYCPLSAPGLEHQCYQILKVPLW